MRINDPNLLQQVVKYLDRHQDAFRIKKMLYCLCTRRWEKDNDYLDLINFQYLIEQIVRENSTLAQFRVLLQDLIKTVNKPKQYIAVAKIIYLAIGQLYPEFRQEHAGKGTPAPAIPTPHPEPTNSARDVASAFQRAYAPEPTQLTDRGVPAAIERADTPAPTQAFSSQVVPSASERAYTPAATPQAAPVPVSDELGEFAYESYYEPLSDSGQSSDGTVPEYDPFVLRQNVMSCTNPLRAKIILLVMLRPDFNFSSQSAATMREYQLDDLLLEVLKAYPTMPQLEESMTGAVEQLVELEEYGKAANGLLQSLAPLYPNIGVKG